MSRPMIPLTPGDLESVSPLLWGLMVLSVLLATGLGAWTATTRGGGPAERGWLLPVAGAAVLAGSAMQCWLFTRLADGRLFPRVFAAQQRLPGSSPDMALLQLRLTLQLLGWAISVAEALLGMGAAVMGEGTRVVLPTGGLSLAALLMTFPRRSGPWGSSSQLDRWREALSTKSIGYSRVCAGGSPD